MHCDEEQEGVIRLVGGSTEYEGRVEVCSGREWGTICNRYWGQQDAVVVCRQLGYDTNGTNNYGFGVISMSYVL